MSATETAFPDPVEPGTASKIRRENTERYSRGSEEWWEHSRQEVVDAYARLREPEPDPTRPRMAMHVHSGCKHQCLSAACGMTAGLRDPKCMHCQLVEPDRRWSDGTKKF